MFRSTPISLILLGVLAIIAGFFEIFAAFRGGETAGTRALFILGGLVSIAFGVVLSPAPASARSPSRCSSACSA